MRLRMARAIFLPLRVFVHCTAVASRTLTPAILVMFYPSMSLPSIAR